MGLIKNLSEAVQKRFLKRSKTLPVSSLVAPENVVQELSDEEVGFFDNYISGLEYLNGEYTLEAAMLQQTQYIESYRRVAKLPEVDFAIGEISDEVLFSVGTDDPLELEFDAELGEKTKEILDTEFKEILKKVEVNKNLYSLFSRFYIDGQLIVHCDYKDSLEGQQKGLNSLRILEPFNFYFDTEEQKYKYYDGFGIGALTGSYSSNPFAEEDYDIEFDKEEIVRITSGIFEGPIILSDLHNSVRVANILSTLEEMLIPLRYSRSVSRRVFRIDVGGMNAKRAEEYMKKIQNKFKYKKYFDVKTGTISNQQNSISLVEDYWFANREGGRGTEVDTLDEKGSLGEIDDIQYILKKLYYSLKVPPSRMPGSEDGTEFDFGATAIQRDELKFFNFTTRKRKQFLELFYELLKRQVLTKNLMSENDFDRCLDYFCIKFNSENKFFEKMEREIFSERVSQFESLESLLEKGYISKKFMYEKILGFNEEEIGELQKEIQLEKEDPKYWYIKKLEGDDEALASYKRPEPAKKKEVFKTAKLPNKDGMDLMGKLKGLPKTEKQEVKELIQRTSDLIKKEKDRIESEELQKELDTFANRRLF